MDERCYCLITLPPGSNRVVVDARLAYREDVERLISILQPIRMGESDEIPATLTYRQAPSGASERIDESAGLGSSGSSHSADENHDTR